MLRNLASALALLIVQSTQQAAVATPLLAWSDDGSGDRIEIANLDGSGRTPIVGGLSSPVSIAFDPVEQMIYWVDNGTNTIERSLLDGSHQQTIVADPTIAGTPIGLAIDVASRRLYWSDTSNSSIHSAGIDGTDPATVLDSSEITRPTGIFIEETTQKLYWLEDANSNSLLRSNLDGSAIELLNDTFSVPTDLVVDPENERVLVTDISTDQILSYDLTTGSLSTLLTVADPNGISIDWQSGDIYFAARGDSTIKRVRSDGSDLVTIIGNGLSNPYDVLVVPVPEPTSSMLLLALILQQAQCRRRGHAARQQCAA